VGNKAVERVLRPSTAVVYMYLTNKAIHHLLDMYNCVDMICTVNALNSQSYLQEGLYGQIKPQENYCGLAQLRCTCT